MFKGDNRNTKTRYQISSKSTIKTPGQRHECPSEYIKQLLERTKFEN